MSRARHRNAAVAVGLIGTIAATAVVALGLRAILVRGTRTSEALSTAKLAYSTIATEANSENAEVFVRSEGTLVQVTQYPGPDFAPSVSPTGDAIAFVSDRDQPGNMDIYVMQADGTAVRRVTSDPAIDTRPSWSPTGDELAFARDDGQGHFEIWVTDVATSSETQLTANSVDDFAPDWAPDGSSIVFQRYVGTNLELFSMRPDGSGVERLTTLDGSDRDPVWSPDGSAVAFVRDEREAGQSQVFVFSLSSRTAVPLVPHFVRPMEDPVWSADGASITFVSRDDAHYLSLSASVGVGKISSSVAALPADLLTRLTRGYRLLGIDGVA